MQILALFDINFIVFAYLTYKLLQKSFFLVGLCW